MKLFLVALVALVIGYVAGDEIEANYCKAYYYRSGQ